MSAPETKLRLTVGGAVNPRTSVYIIRPSDDELLELLERGEYCNVLCSRQMGKTSLLKRTRARLVKRGYATAEIEVAGLLGSPKDADEWYQGLLDEIARQLRLPVNVPDWWRATSAVTANQKLIRFFRDEVIAQIPGDKPVIIFLDEIDSTLKLPYTDDFFVAIRAMYNDRASDPVNERIAFCLVGVATPNELIKERRTTPYNIGRTIELLDFDPDREDLGPIYRSLCEDETKGEATAREVIRQTGGHPYLTLRVCDALAARPCASPADVAAVVGQTFGSLDSLKSDVHFDQMLRFINERVDDKLSTLDLYRRVIGGKPVPDQTTPAHINLKLIGLVKRDGRGNLVPRNPVYQRLFTDAWARSAMPPVERRVRTARRLAVAAVALLLVGIPLSVYLSRISTLNAQAAQFDARALNAETGEKRDEALIWRLKALATRPTDLRARAANELLQFDFPHLLMTFRNPLTPPIIFHIGGNPIDSKKQNQLIPVNGAINVVAFSSYGRTVLTGSADGTARLWNAETGEPIGQPMRHDVWVSEEILSDVSTRTPQPGAICAAIFSPDGGKVLTGSADRTARLWNALDGKPIGEVMRHASGVFAVAFSPDGSKVLTGSLDGTARLWSAQDGKPIGEPMRHRTFVNAVAFSSDGRTVLTGSDDRTARLWSAQDGKPIGEPMRHGSGVLAVAFSPDNRKVLSGSDNGTARLWNVEDGKPIGEPMRHEDRVQAVAFSPDGQTVLTGSSDGTARMWNAEDGKPVGEAMRHASQMLAMAFSPDGRTVLTGNDDYTARLWSAQDGKPIGEPMRHANLVRAVAFSPDGSKVLTGSWDGTARLWSAQDGKPIGEAMRHADLVGAMAFSPDGSKALTGSKDRTARLWSAQTGDPVGKQMRHADSVRAVAFSPDGNKVLTGSKDGTARLWSAQTGDPVGKQMRHASWAVAVAFSPDGRKVLTGSGDGTARLWNAQTGDPIGKEMRHESFVRAVAFSPDGSKVLTGSVDGTARLWSAQTGDPIGEAMRHAGWVFAVAFSPDGSKVLTGSKDGTARLWSAQTGDPIGKQMRHASWVVAVAFSPDGSKVLTGSFYGTARLWSTQTGDSIGKEMRHEASVLAVAFSPDGSKVLTGSLDRTARLWNAQTGDPIGKEMRHADGVFAVAFSPDRQLAVVLTQWWLHVAQSDEANGLVPIISRLLPGAWPGVFDLVGESQPPFLDAAGSEVRIGVLPTGDSLRVARLRLDRPDAEPIQGDPAQLLADWQRRLGLKINEAGEIVPQW